MYVHIMGDMRAIAVSCSLDEAAVVMRLLKS